MRSSRYVLKATYRYYTCVLNMYFKMLIPFYVLCPYVRKDLLEVPPAIKMSYGRVVEMFCVIVSMSRAYRRPGWSVDTPWNYFVIKYMRKHSLHPSSRYLLSRLLWQLKEGQYNNMREFYAWYRQAKDYLKINYMQDAIDY